MKKILALLMSIAMVGGLVACGNAGTQETATEATEAATEEAATADTTDAAADDTTYTIGICQLVQHEALDAATEGFKDALTEAFKPLFA